MTTLLRVFVSSVQKELEDERLIVQNLIMTDPFLSAHCSPILYEFEPAAPETAIDGSLKTLDSCNVYLLIAGSQYGTMVGTISITHLEFRRATERTLPRLVFIKGTRDLKRDDGMVQFLDEVDRSGLKYKRFGNVIELQKEARAALVKLLQDQFGLIPTSDEDHVASQTIEATSPFESQALKHIRWRDLDSIAIRGLISALDRLRANRPPGDDFHAELAQRGLVWQDAETGHLYATAAGIVLLASDPSSVFPQCRILADAYRGTEPDGNPRDQEDIRGPMPLAIDRAVAFVDRNTRHPMRISGLNRVRVDEYPIEALREALVNAVAHRLYEDAGRKIMLEVCADHIVIASPGLPPKPLTLSILRKGRYRPCSRNPVLAQCLSLFHHIEERGSGLRRMKDAMLNHGLDAPVFSTEAGYFVVHLPGPADNLDRIRLPAEQLKVTPAIEASLNERQRQMMRLLLEGQVLTSRRCEAEFKVTRDTANRDFALLIQLGLATRHGRGRSTSYSLASPSG